MNIYVGNLCYTATEAELRTAFERYGKVSTVAIVIDRRTRRARGYAFVEMLNDQEAWNAIKALDGSDFQGRSLRVDQSQPRTDRRQSGNDRRIPPGSRRQEDTGVTAGRKDTRNGGLFGFIKRIFGR
jgi:RNA recognition motif-containing protein